MFTGLIEEKGSITDIRDDGPGAKKITLCADVVREDAIVGCSIAINGCCLTVVEFGNNSLSFQAGSETMHRTNLGQLRVGDQVNLERAVKANDRLGGHIVSGHIDGVGTIEARNDTQDWSEFWFAVPPELTRQMAIKGSVAIDGISLTLVNVEDNRFSVALIPHTLAETTLGQRQVGDAVNIETDILAKYVERQLSALRK